MRINIKTIPHNKQRYDTCGDYWVDKRGTIQVRISEESNEKYEWLVLLHELTEMCLAKYQGVDWDKIDAFDIEFEKNRKGWDNSEPGDAENSPYYKQHHLATVVERLICHELELNWEEYEESLE